MSRSGLADGCFPVENSINNHSLTFQQSGWHWSEHSFSPISHRNENLQLALENMGPLSMERFKVYFTSHFESMTVFFS